MRELFIYIQCQRVHHPPPNYLSRDYINYVYPPKNRDYGPTNTRHAVFPRPRPRGSRALPAPHDCQLPPAGCRPRCTGRTLEKETAHGTSGTSHQGLSGRSVATPPTDCPVQFATDCPVQLATDYPVQFTTDCPVQLATDSPVQLATDSPDQFSDGLSRPDGL